MEYSEANLPKPLRLLNAYWRQKRGERPMPSRADISPVEMQDFLPDTLLLDVLRQEQGKMNFRVRLAGVQILNGYGRDVSQKRIDEIDLGDQQDKIYQACLHSVMTGKPAYLSGRIRQQAADEYIAYERLGVPLPSDGKNVDILLVAVWLRRSPKPF